VKYYYIYIFMGKGLDIKLEVKKMVKDKKLLYVSECVCVIYECVHCACIGCVTRIWYGRHQKFIIH